jgi:hypothetical protein
MKNISGHDVEWSMQSVSQYDTADPNDRSHLNHDFWAFTPANPASKYLNRYHVRFGPAENRAVSVRENGLFALHYIQVAAELWLDSTAGWLAVVNGATGHAMVERFRYEENKPYPGNASVIFWTNGSELKVNDDGIPSLSSAGDGENPYYLEAEINSPLCRLRPGETCNLDTDWFPTRGNSKFQSVSDAGIIMRPLRSTLEPNGKFRLSGTFGVFFSGRLVARLYDQHGASLGSTSVLDVSPAELVSLDTEISANEKAARLSLHLQDASGVDRGPLQEVPIRSAEDN